MEDLKKSLDKALPPSALLKTCKRCKEKFDPARNSPPGNCRHHTLSFAGETKQRFLAPGENNGEGAQVVYHWWCCSSEDEDAPGCAVTTHVSYDD